MKRLLPLPLLVLCYIANLRAAPLNHSEIARCIFVYAPMQEVATKQNDQRLRSYSLQRLMYVRGVVEANRSNKDFVAAFDGGLQANKAAGVKIEQDLQRAYRESDSALYNRTLRQAEQCDQSLNIVAPK